MSLKNRIIATVLAVILGLALSTLYILSDSARRTLLTQLESHASDGATHLGLYLAPHLQQRDIATIETAVNVIFDSGFYQQVEVLDADGAVLYGRTHASDVPSRTPAWFVRLINIAPSTMKHDVTFKWQPVGSIHIRSRAGYAYEQLWTGVRNTLLLSATLSILAALVLSALVRIQLKPLQDVERQAMALTRREYISQPCLPKTRELRRVVTAMNLMVQQVEIMFNEQNRNMEALRTAAYRDSLTGLNNRRATLAQLGEYLEFRKDSGPASLVILRLNNLQRLNEELGEDSTNHLIQTCAHLLDKLGDNLGFHVTGRLSGAELVLLARRHSYDQWRQLLEPLSAQIHRIREQSGHEGESSDIVSIGISHQDSRSSTETLLSQARLAADQALQCQQVLCGYNQTTPAHTWSLQWREHVAHVIGNGQIFLQQQTLYTPDGKPVHAEVFARILNRDNQPSSAGEFFGVARDLNLLPVIDRLVIQKALNYLNRHPDAIGLSINLANQTLAQNGFVDWLLRELRYNSTPERLSIEVNETAILTQLDNIHELRTALAKLGVAFGVDNFGTHPNGFSYLYALRPDYLKIDGSLVRQLDNSDEDRFFVSSLISVAHSLEIKTFSEHVEREQQYAALIQVGIDGTQGYLHGQPEALPPVSDM